MTSFRFETYENVITKHTLSKVNWTQAARWAFSDHFNQKDWTVARVRVIDNDSVEIIKRRDCNKSLIYKMGGDQQGVYQRVVINRNDQTVAVDRFNINWKTDAPFMARRDLFMPAKRLDGGIDFIRHEFWLHKLLKMQSQMFSNLSAWSYRRAFRKQETPSA